MQSTGKALLTKPRLLIILNRFVIGGQAVDTIPLAHLLKNDFDILIVYGEKEKDEIEPDFLLEKYPGLVLQKISSLRRSINPFTDIVALYKLLVTIRKFRPHIVHTHGAKSGFLGRLAAFLYRVPVIIHTFHGHFFHSYFSSAISKIIAAVERGIGKLTTCTVALSHTQKNELVNQFKIVPEHKVKIIPLGFDIAQHTEPLIQRKAFRSRYSLEESAIAVGIVGRIVPVKNHMMFLQVIKKVLSEAPQVPLVFFIIGDGDTRYDMEAWLRDNSIAFSTSGVTETCRVVFTSWLTYVEEIMCGLDIIALTSLNEGTPLTLIEAQFFERPVVCTNVGGVKDTMADGRTGYLTHVNDVEEFTKNLLALAADTGLRKEMGKAGREFVVARFDKQKEVEITKQFYLGLLHTKLNQ